MARENNGSSIFVVGFLLGAAAGIAAALMTAPRSGEETLEQLRVYADQIKLRSLDLKGQAISLVVQEAHRLQEYSGQLRNRAGDQAHRFRQSAREQFEQMESSDILSSSQPLESAPAEEIIKEVASDLQSAAQEQSEELAERIEKGREATEEALGEAGETAQAYSQEALDEIEDKLS